MNYDSMTRKELQKRLAGKPKLQVRLRELNLKRADVQAKVDLGHLTERALSPIQTEIEDVMREIAALTNEVPNHLLNTCPDDGLHEEFRAGRRRRIDLIARLQRQRSVVESEETVLKEWTEKLDMAEADDARQHYEKEAADCKRGLEYAREEVLGLERQFAELEAERDALKRRMIAA